MRRLEEESAAVETLKQKVKVVTADIEKSEDLLNEVNIASTNFFMILQKYKIDPVSDYNSTAYPQTINL